MSKLFWQMLRIAPVAIGASLLTAGSALAQAVPNSTVNNTNSVDGVLNQINEYNGTNGTRQSNSALSQVTNVNQLRDVSPTDWAFEALRSLVDRYGCIVGYPNQTFRGNQALSRYEFAAGLNACLNQIERLIASSEAILREDIDTLNRLTQEFEAELATLSGRVDNLESRTAFLEDHQFSTTTKLNGEVIFALADTFGDGAVGNDETQTTFSDRVRLNFDTSFTGRDRLRTRLQANNTPEFDDDLTGTDSTRLGFDGDDDNNIELEALRYRFPIGDRITAHIGTVGLELDDIFELTNPVLESSGTGALSRFNRRNPLVFRGPEGAGAGATYEFSEQFALTALYLAEDASNPNDGAGLFNGSFSTGAQIKVTPIETLDLTFTYVRSHEVAGEVDLTSGTSSGFAQDPFDGEATNANRFGLGANYVVGDRINISAYGGFIDASPAGDNDDDLDADILTWGGNVSFLDLGREGAVLSVAGGRLPSITSSDGVPEEEDTPYIVEGLYKFPLNDNIFITPGAFVVFNPDGEEDSDTVVVGVIRTTFKF